MSIYTTIEKITPSLAKAYLDANTMNRPVRETHIAKLAHDMASGNYHSNGATIVFNGDGTLLDGQHRLMAIVESGVSIEMLVVRGVAKAAMKTIDANISRKASDVAQMMGHTSAHQLVGTVRLLMNARNGVQNNSNWATTSQIMEFLQSHPHLQDVVSAVTKMQKVAPVTTVASWYYLAVYKAGCIDEANRALKVIETGIPSYHNDAIHAFRERYLRDKASFQGSMANRVRALWTLNTAWHDFLTLKPRLLCKIQHSEVRMVGVDYSAL
jgi:hypothetical protein